MTPEVSFLPLNCCFVKAVVELCGGLMTPCGDAFHEQACQHHMACEKTAIAHRRSPPAPKLLHRRIKSIG